MSYFRESYIVIVEKKTKFGFNFSNYATKSDLKGIKAIDRSKFAKKIDSVNLKADVDRLEKE